MVMKLDNIVKGAKIIGKEAIHWRPLFYFSMIFLQFYMMANDFGLYSLIPPGILLLWCILWLFERVGSQGKL